MSYSALMKHRCTLKELQQTFTNGVPMMDWVEIASNIPCFLDLNFIRRGKDPMWTPEAGRVSDRVGVAFFKNSAPIQSGQRIVMTKGPSGTFLIEGAVDQAWRPVAQHHVEVGVTEVPTQISKGKGPK